MAIIIGLSIYGVGTIGSQQLDPNASGFAMLVWGIQTVLLIVLGIYAFVMMEVDRRRLTSKRRKQNNDQFSWGILAPIDPHRAGK